MTGIKVDKGLYLFWIIIWLGAISPGMAERLYEWTDEKGQVHLTQEPPPRQGKLHDIMDYSAAPEQKKETQIVQPSNARDPDREEKILLELERRRLEGTENAIEDYKRKQTAETAGPNSCFVEVPDQDMYVRVFDIDDSGSRGQKIWSGWIKKYEKRLFNSRRGRVSIDFKVGAEKPYHTQDVRICDNGSIIKLSPR